MKLTRQTVIGEFLKRARVRRELTQVEVAAKMGYSTPQFVSNWERGESLPPITDLKKLTRVLRVSPSVMLQAFRRYDLLVAQERERDLKKSLGLRMG